MARALLKPYHEQQQTAMPGRVDEGMVMGQLVKGHFLHSVGPQGSVSHMSLFLVGLGEPSIGVKCCDV